MKEPEAKIAGLEGVIGLGGVGTGFFRRCLAKDQGDSAAERRQWREHIYAEIRSRTRSQGGITVKRMADLTYLRLEQEFAYLAVVLDGYGCGKVSHAKCPPR